MPTAQDSSLGQASTSAWDRSEALQLSFQDKIHKYRRAAGGGLDRESVVEAPKEVRRVMLSPRSQGERDEIRQLVRNRRMKDAALERRVKAHETLEHSLRLPNPMQRKGASRQEGGLWSY